MTTPTRRRALAGVPALVLAAVLSACGSSDAGSEAATEAGTGDTTSSGALPVTIDHKYGTTEITEEPERIAVVGVTEQDALLALGISPVATTQWLDDTPGAIYPWAQDEFEATGAELPTLLDATNGIPVEDVAAVQPDLIIGIWSGMTQAEYDLLSKIAPTLAQPADYADYATPWEVGTEIIGEAVGKPEEAKALVEETLGLIDQAAAEHPEFEGKKAAVITPYDGLWVYGPTDGRGRLLEQLGFVFPEALEDPEADSFGWALSSEQTSKLADVDVVVWIDLAKADAGMTQLWEQTPTFAEGRYIDVNPSNGAYYGGHSFVSPLSVPFILERYVPQLAAAVDGDPATEVPPVTG